jgi:ribA/ribD-fused uncharacterized protein
MFNKALLMDDKETAKKILSTHDPKLIKKYGREVKNFDFEKWDKNKYKIVLNGNYLKFSQNDKIKKILLDTGNNLIAEAASYDNIWGIGLNEHDALNTPINKWSGQNLLGKVLMEVRSMLNE